MEFWNNEIKQWGKVNNCSPSFSLFAAGIYLPMLHKGAIPSFHFSNIPTFPLRSEAELNP
jgi:hypothetical protein